MCTVSFLPKSQGFYLAMNRDEKLDRFTALAPAISELGSRRAVFPREPTGGTWISANDAGICLALINWHRIEREPKHDVISRGEIVKALAGRSSAEEIVNGVMKLPLRKLRPFRLIAIVPSRKIVIEWCWNLDRLNRRNHEWQRRHWFSSGFDEARAERERAEVCASFVAGGDDPGKHETSSRPKQASVNAAGYSLNWLRQLHCSHAPAHGPFSICMHRPDAATVSYTEVAVRNRQVIMRYRPGPACSPAALVAKSISRAL
jgi:hypothetical protein